jgi:hypothetical protein
MIQHICLQLNEYKAVTHTESDQGHPAIEILRSLALNRENDFHRHFHKKRRSVDRVPTSKMRGFP